MTIALKPQSTPNATPAHSACGRLSGWIRAHPLLALVGLSYALSWGYWLPLLLTGQIVRLGSTVTQSQACSAQWLRPSSSPQSPRPDRMVDLLRRALRWRVPARWWLFALGSPAALAGAAVLVMAFRSANPT